MPAIRTATWSSSRSLPRATTRSPCRRDRERRDILPAVNDTATLAGRTILMSGGSRGIGLAIAVRAARDGANVALIAKTDTPDPRLPGTIHTAAAEIEAAGGKALPILGDIRDDDTVAAAVQRTVDT